MFAFNDTTSSDCTAGTSNNFLNFRRFASKKIVDGMRQKMEKMSTVTWTIKTCVE
jgi:hypothetical protein